MTEEAQKRAKCEPPAERQAESARDGWGCRGRQDGGEQTKPEEPKLMEAVVERRT